MKLRLQSSRLQRIETETTIVSSYSSAIFIGLLVNCLKKNMFPDEEISKNKSKFAGQFSEENIS